MSGLLLDPSCQDDLSTFKSILECFSYTFTHKIHQKMPRNAAKAENLICICPHGQRYQGPNYNVKSAWWFPYGHLNLPKVFCFVLFFGLGFFFSVNVYEFTCHIGNALSTCLSLGPYYPHKLLAEMLVVLLSMQHEVGWGYHLVNLLLHSPSSPRAFGPQVWLEIKSIFL